MNFHRIASFKNTGSARNVEPVSSSIYSIMSNFRVTTRATHVVTCPLRCRCICCFCRSRPTARMQSHSRPGPAVFTPVLLSPSTIPVPNFHHPDHTRPSETRLAPTNNLKTEHVWIFRTFDNIVGCVTAGGRALSRCN